MIAVGSQRDEWMMSESDAQQYVQDAHAKATSADER